MRKIVAVAALAFGAAPDPSSASTLEAAQAPPRRANIGLDIETADHAVDRARLPLAQMDLPPLGYSQSSAGTPGAVRHFSHCNAARAEIGKARAAIDPGKQKAFWKEARRKIIETVCAAPAIETTQARAWETDVAPGYGLQGSLKLAPPIAETAVVED